VRVCVCGDLRRRGDASGLQTIDIFELSLGLRSALDPVLALGNQFHAGIPCGDLVEGDGLAASGGAG
jgi:hypothetical protein